MKDKKETKDDDPTTGIWKDPRFSHLVNDPRFKHLPKSMKKIKIDNRFESMFKDDKFKIKYTVDKYGRPNNKKSSSDDLRKYYDLSSDEDDEKAEDEKIKEEKAIQRQDDESSDSDDENDDLLVTGEEKLDKKLKNKLKDLTVDYARGEGKILGSDSSDDESSQDEDEELYIEHVWGELDRDAPTTDDSTNRIAILHMDWDRIRAVDILVLCNSFLPPGGTILSVSIFPSDYGKERMAEEEVKGPMELTENKEETDSDSDREEDGEEGRNYHMEKLRQYQLNRLKYYYAVIVCDTVLTADKLYQECDGLEYESSASKMDMRFVPDDMTFDDEPTEVCTDVPDLSKYKPRLFTTTALQQAKVELTWDELDVDRKEMNDKITSGKFDEVTDADLRKYVAYSSEEENPDEKSEAEDSDNEDNCKEDPINKYKSLLSDINKKEDEVKKSKIEKELTWGIGINEKSEKKKVAPKTDRNPFEKLIEKKKEKNKAKRKERKQKTGKKTSDDEDGWSSDDLPDGIDMNDPYFAEEFAKGDYVEKKKESKNKKKHRDELNSEDEQQQAELALLLDDGQDDKAHFSLKKIQDAENESKSKSKRKKKLKKTKQQIEDEKNRVEDNFIVDVKDNRFNALYTSHLYNIDPTDSHFKKTKGMEDIITEKLKRRPVDEMGNEEIQPKRTKKDVAVSMLVKSIKRKVANKM